MEVGHRHKLGFRTVMECRMRQTGSDAVKPGLRIRDLNDPLGATWSRPWRELEGDPVVGEQARKNHVGESAVWGVEIFGFLRVALALPPIVANGFAAEKNL